MSLNRSRFGSGRAAPAFSVAQPAHNNGAAFGRVHDGERGCCLLLHTGFLSYMNSVGAVYDRPTVDCLTSVVGPRGGRAWAPSIRWGTFASLPRPIRRAR